MKNLLLTKIFPDFRPIFRPIMADFCKVFPVGGTAAASQPYVSDHFLHSSQKWLKNYHYRHEIV